MNFSPNTRLTLYDFGKSNICQGTLLINSNAVLTPQRTYVFGDIGFYLENLPNFFSLLTSSFRSSLTENYFEPKLDEVNSELADIYYYFEGFLNNVKIFFSSKNILRKLALVCLGFSLIGFFSVGYPVISSTIRYSFVPKVSSAKANQDPPKIANNIKVPFPSIEPPKLIDDFRISIPKIQMESKVIPNVDSTKENVYKMELQKGVAHAAGSFFPGDKGPVVLFAHSTDSVFDIAQYNAKFFGIKDLDLNDEVDLFFEGKEYKYSISDKKIIDPSDVDYLRNPGTDLFLVTCWPPGTDLQRLVLSATLQAN